MTRAAKGCLLVLALTATASAETRVASRSQEDPKSRVRTTHDVIATQPFELFAKGLAVSYEHAVSPRWSAVGLLGVRGAADGDYASLTWDSGAEARWYFRARDPRVQSGPYVGLHASLGRTTMSERATGDDIGASWGLSQRVDLGWRFTIHHRIAITPSAGFGAREDVDTRAMLATTARPMVAIGLELGWIR